MNGIDISNWQKDIDAGAVPGDFVICKATEGTSYVSPSCDRQYQAAKRAGKLLGVYHFATGAGAAAEADWFVKNIKGYIGEAILVLDWEANALKKGVSYALEFLRQVHSKTGVWPLIYMSQSVVNQYDWSEVAKLCGLWVAQYPSVNTVNGYQNWDFTKTIKHWKTVAIWQYASTGKLQGYAANLDLNKAYMTREAWMRYAGSTTASAPSTDVSVGNSTSILENDEYTVTINKK